VLFLAKTRLNLHEACTPTWKTGCRILGECKDLLAELMSTTHCDMKTALWMPSLDLNTCTTTY